MFPYTSKQIILSSQSDFLLNTSMPHFCHLTLPAALYFGFLQVRKADKNGLTNILLLLHWRVFHCTAAAPGLQQLSQHLNQSINNFVHPNYLGTDLFHVSDIQHMTPQDGPQVLMPLSAVSLPTHRANFVFERPKRSRAWPAEKSRPSSFNILLNVRFSNDKHISFS